MKIADQKMQGFLRTEVKMKKDFFIRRMDLDGSLQIEWDEWRQFHLLNPHAHNIKDILKFWKHATVSVLLLQNLFLKYLRSSLK